MEWKKCFALQDPNPEKVFILCVFYRVICVFPRVLVTQVDHTYH